MTLLNLAHKHNPDMKYFLILLLLFSSCSIIDIPSNKANRKLKRANRLIAQAEQLGVNWKVDTVFKEIPLFIDSVRVDSIFTAKPGDTVRIEKERLKIKYVRLAGDSVYIEGKCDTLTVIKEVPISVTKEIKTGLSVLDVLKWVLMAVVVAVILTKLLWR